MKNKEDIIKEVDEEVNKILKNMYKNWDIQEFTPAHTLSYIYPALYISKMKENNLIK
ncbi:hypothetical protein [Clostridium botulinum]|uniref:hypothetical protein n=1 Tax=Clostridium botulinum TaxID=1491 RepID=UPI001C9B4E02|nr:hypothetical protein [Clostridium botulinum]MBY6842688.1 hypothetical protein [Clostridium botulinum]